MRAGVPVAAGREARPQAVIGGRVGNERAHFAMSQT